MSDQMNCHHCGTETPRTRSNKKWCSRCKWLKAILAFTKNTRACDLCGEDYWPVDRGEVHCEPCMERLEAVTSGHGHPMDKPCSICGTQDRGFAGAPELNICRRCVKQAANPKRRKAIVKACLTGLESLARRGPANVVE